MKIGNRANAIEKRWYGRYEENTYKKLREHGYLCSDFNMMNTDSVIYKESTQNAEKLLTHEKELATEAGIEIYQTHGPWCWPLKDTTSEGRKERMEKMKKSIYFTSVLGCKLWVIHPVMPFEANDTEKGKEAENLEINLNFFRELLCTAKEYGVVICVENLPFEKFSLATPESILSFVNEFNDENIKICFDTGHAEALGLNAGNEARKLGEKIKALHIHDSVPGKDLHLAPYGGKILWEEFVKALKDINFDGSFSLETLPGAELCDKVFENECKRLCKEAKEICKNAHL